MISQELLAKLSSLESVLSERIIGQEHVIPRIAEVIRQGELGLTSKNEPRGCFFFLGPTGVGKTETAKTFARHLYGENHFFTLDMSEFKYPDSIIHLIGDHTGKVGRLGKILEIASEGIILFDEIEKAHPDIRDLFLQMYDEARITVGDGKVYSLSKFYLVITSNIGSRKIIHGRHTPFTTIENYVIREVSREFRPELIRRFRHIIVFDKLSLENQTEICRLVLEEEIKRLHQEHGFRISYEPDLLPFLLEQGYDEIYGARNLRNIIQFMIRKTISDQLMKGGGFEDICLI